MIALALALALFVPYDRDDWPHWLDADADCQDTRQEVLIRDSIILAQLDPTGCRVVAGFWIDPYTLQGVSDPGELQVDHVVALEEAYVAGGSRWKVVRRALYANALNVGHLVATRSRVNATKGSRPPNEWRPPNRQTWCFYGRARRLVKKRWKLRERPEEKNAVDAMLETCKPPTDRKDDPDPRRAALEDSLGRE